MPELPEVETIVSDLNKEILGRKIQNVWTDSPEMIKLPKNFEQFRQEIRRKKIKKILRRGKNILFYLSGGKILLIHQKLTGHLLYGIWNLEYKPQSSSCPSNLRLNSIWKPKIKGPLEEKINTFIHLLFILDNGKMLALSDLRKLAKVELLDRQSLKKELSSLGPEPLEKNFTFVKFKEILNKKKGKIKQILMDQRIIAGIGNIYSDEILWQAKIHPFKDVSRLKEKDLKKIYQAMKNILLKAIKLGGESISDFRRISGERGYFDKERKVYRKENEKCFRCDTIIKRIKLTSRSAYFCPNCQSFS